MDIFRRKKFDEAMFAKNRTLAIRVGQYQSSDIKEASFDYGYIKGDTYKPGGTCAGSAKIVFTSIITTFNKLDKVYPEIGLLVDGTYEWVKMGEYFINDIEIDRNRKTTKLDLMDGMFKLNREHVTDLTYPAEIRHVIKEICLKTGVKLANENMDIASMNYRIESIPKEKKMTFRDVLSLASQMLGMSCFFNREGKLEIKELTDSGITITADSYFMHGLTKSEVEYQIAGITCKKEKETLTVGLRTGRSLEIENVLMYQSALDNLYHSIKDIRYYPYNLNYQGHLLLEVGQWVTIKTNTGETFKSPVLSQSFNFKGGLRGRISADSKAGNDAQYSYAGTITKKIVQFNEFEAQIQNQIEEVDKGFDQKVAKIKKDFSDQVELAKAKTEEVKRQLSDTIDQRLNSFNSGPLQEVKRRAEEALRNAGASSLLAQEAKRIGLDSIAKLEEFKRQATSAQTALSGDLDALKRTIANDIRPKQEQVTAEIAKQVEALNRTKNELAGVKSAQATYEETTTRRLAELSNLTDGKASKSELVQTAEELKSRIASVQASGRNLFLNSLFKQDIRKTGIWTTSTYTATIDSESKYLGHNALKIVGQDPTGRDSNNPKITYPATGQYGKVAPGSMTNQDVTISFYAKAEKAGTILRSRLGNINFKDGNVSLTTEVKRYVVKLPKSWTNWSKITTNEWLFNLNRADTVWIWMPKFEVSDTDTPYSEAPEDVEGLISAVESTFKQRADSLEASVSSLREGLKSKADSSALTLLSERISASVKSLETDTQNKLDSKLSTAEFEVRASGIRQEIITATKDKADKTLVTAEAGRLREELASQIGSGRNLWINSKIAGNPVVEALPAGHITGQKQCYKLTNNQELSFNIEPDFSSRLFRKVTFSAWVKYENVVRGANNWNVFNCFKHYMILKNSQTGTVSGASYLTLAGYDGTSDWKRIVFTYDYSANKGYDQLKTLLKFNLEGVRGGVAWITGVQVEFGSVANEYAPALEDVEGLITEAKATFERTAQGLRTDLSAIQKYVNKDGQRQEALQRYTREESARQATAVRELVTREFVGKSTYQEDVRGLERRFEAITNPQNGSIVTQIATYKNAVDGRFAEITSMISGKANQTDFQRVQETSRLYERILGNTNNSISDNVARMAMTSQLFQVEVGKYGSDGINRALNTSKGWTSFITIASPAGINLNADLHKVVASGLVAGDKLHVCLEISIDDVQPITGKTATAVLQSWGDVKKWNSGNPFGYRLGNLIAGNNWRKIEYDVTLTEQMLGNNFWWLNVRVDGASRYKVHTKLLKIEKGSRATPWSPAPEDSDEAIRTVQSQLAGSWAVQNLTSAGSIVSQINATNNQILIEAEKIRLKGKTLLDELTAIQGYFKRLFVGDASVGTLNSDIIRSNSITADKLVMDIAMARRFVSSDIFTDTLAAKEAFINKLRSVVVTATLLEGYKGRIGGFQIGTHEKDSSVYWITGQNQFSVGMSNGTGQWSQTALWVNWGNNWGYPGDYAWYVKNNGKMYCYNTAEFWNTPVIHGNLRVTGHIYYNNENSGKSGHWIHSSKYSNFEPSNNYLYLYYSGSGYDWIPMNKEISDRRYKHNIEDSTVSGLDVIQKLKTYSYRKEYDGKIEDIACGIMAQDVQKYAPEAFFENPDGAYSYNTFALVPYLIKAIQELNHKIEKLEKTA